jgi:hypothetical protein
LLKRGSLLAMAMRLAICALPKSADHEINAAGEAALLTSL